MKTFSINKKLIAAFFISILILAGFVGNLYSLAVHTTEMLSPETSSQAGGVLNGTAVSEMQAPDGDTNIFADVLENFVWSSLFLWMPLFLCWYLILCFGVRLKKPDFSEPAERTVWLLCLLRYVIAVFVLFTFLTHHTFWWNDVAQDFIHQLSQHQNYIRWCLSWLLFTGILLDWKKVRASLPVSDRIRKAIVFFGVPYICMALIELQCSSKLILLPYMCIYSYIYWLLLEAVLFLLVRRVKPVAVVCLLAAYLVGLANQVVFQLRGNYITFGDLTAIGTALEVAGNYTFKPNFYFWISLLLLLASLAAIFAVRLLPPKKCGKKMRVLSISGTVLLTVCIFWCYQTGFLYRNINGVSWDYNANIAYTGYMPYFLSNMHAQQRVACEGYSVEAARKALENQAAEPLLSKPEKAPNIIIVQNEAFSDLSVVYDIETDQEPMPYIRSLRDNTVKGYLNLSVMAGPTANTEFEVLARSSLAFLPYGCVPYSQYLKQHIPSLAELLKNQDTPYHTVAYHSYYSSGYNRVSAYNYMGFDESIFENSFTEDYSEEQIFRNYLTDEANFDRVIQLYEENSASRPDQPFFCFNVTVQNHGGYFGTYAFDEPVSVTNFDAPEAVNTYLSCIRMSDAAFRKLTEYFQSVEEPTIILMYGDHQPSFSDEDVELLSEHPAWQDEQMQAASRYYVPYVIWANYDIEEKDTMGTGRDTARFNTVSANFLSSLLLQYTGAALSSYDNYLIELHKAVPALSSLGYWTEDGTYYPSISDGAYREKLAELQKIQYNLLFDHDEKLWEEFTKKAAAY